MVPSAILGARAPSPAKSLSTMSLTSRGRVTLSIGDPALPALYRAADVSSLNAQQWFLRGTIARLTLFIGAALFGLFTWTTEGAATDWAGAAAALCFFSALVIELGLLKHKPERTWYEGRAAAESVKTLSWRYMMRAEPFVCSGDQNEVDRIFLDRLCDVLSVLKDLDLVIVPQREVGEQITPRMREVRNARLEDRKATYDVSRVAEQQSWYLRKARWNRRRDLVWTLGMLGVELGGVVAALLKTTGMLRGDVLGVAGAVVAAMAAWLQAKQHRTLAAAYGVTALELASVRSRIAAQATEAAWASFVADAEEAFSREHTLWKASRAVRA